MRWRSASGSAAGDRCSAWPAACGASAAGLRRARDWGWLPVTLAVGLLVQLAVTHVYG
ncbi:MAG TPA: hypothetical protein VMF07_13470 [Solirubrobacteraceae bacterium]|nr:hypothetical protein [Solirubrobacteraceae bacterium]